MTRLRRLVTAGVAVLFLGAVAALGGGFLLFNRPHADPLSKADAIVVLGGDWDGRVEFGLDLARRGYADTVLLSDGYPMQRRVELKRICADGVAGVRVICFQPEPYSTLGEAKFVAELAEQNHWTHLIVVSWNYHMVRARYIFGQCFDGEVTMRPVPRSYDRIGVSEWLWIYSYQYAALAKAAILGCHR